MDPDKVDAVTKWKTPTNRDLLHGFLGSVGYLADDIGKVRILMGHLHELTSDSVPFRWGFTEERAFQEVKRLTGDSKFHHRRPLDYSDKAPPVWMITDGCATGIAGVIMQGNDWNKGVVAAFYSAKLNPAQQNYPVHEIEMLAGVETMLRHRDILQGVEFTWVTDHKGLIHLINQPKLSGRQARWLEKISEFNFAIKYLPGVDNVFADALSHIYSNDAPGTVCAPSEYMYHDIVPNWSLNSLSISMPLLVDVEASCLVPDVVYAGPMALRRDRKPS
jgi:hypothetical protein